jgi:hypothetical protein
MRLVDGITSIYDLVDEAWILVFAVSVVELIGESETGSENKTGPTTIYVVFPVHNVERMSAMVSLS